MNPLSRTAELRRLEAQSAAGLAPGTLMARAGQGAARWLDAQLAARPASFLVLCGPGNNGGDGYVCARVLREMGHACVCWAPAPPAPDDARQAHDAWRRSGGSCVAQLPTDRFDVIVDAMFGIGLARPLSGPYLQACERVNGSAARRIALDVPSGLDADRGTWVGAVAGFRAHATVTFLADKPGLHMSDGCDAAGSVHVETLGMRAEACGGWLNGTAWFAPVLQPRAHNTHKGSYGNLAVIGADLGMIGAVLLAGRSALRLGAGRVYVCSVGDPDLRVDPVCPELMIRALERLPPVQAAVVGCGLGTSDASARALRHALALEVPLVLDADALNLLASHPALRETLIARRSPAVLTPHPAEAARLLATPPAQVNADRISAAQELSRQLKATLVLKGAGTVIAHGAAAPQGPTYWINPTGGPALATAGTGDVLSGMIGALIAQGFELRDAVLAAVWLHGCAAQIHHADAGLLASEVPQLAAQELARLRNAAAGR